MKKQEHKQLISIDQFNETVSLYQLIPHGAGRGLSHLKIIVDSILHNPEAQQVKPLSLLIVGKQGARTYSRGFIRALGVENINETPAQLLNAPPNAIQEFFNPLLPAQSFLVSNIEALYPAVLKTLYEIISKGQYVTYNYQRRTKEIIFVHKPVVVTASSESKIPKYFKEKLDHIVQLEDYIEQGLELIVLQRLKFPACSFPDLLYDIIGFTHFLSSFPGKDARLWSQKPTISSNFLHAGNYLKLSLNSNNYNLSHFI